MNVCTKAHRGNMVLLLSQLPFRHMDQATVIVGVQKIADVQRDDYNRSGTLISAAGAHACCPNVVYASMLINDGYTSETYNICERRVYRTKKPRRRKKNCTSMV